LLEAEKPPVTTNSTPEYDSYVELLIFTVAANETIEKRAIKIRGTIHANVGIECLPNFV
jgi:hypothetical protein